MPIYQVLENGIQPLLETTFAAAGVKEREHLQDLLKRQVQIIAPDTLIIAEEFGNWEDSRRRIDLLGIDENASLVVIELKRTEDGGHMELQAIRYAAMVSAMTFDSVVEVYGQYLKQLGRDGNARDQLLEFLGWNEPDEEKFAQDVRIILASAEFSKEITTSVLWLNDQGLDIRCIRLKPYRDGTRLLLDVQQVIPLPDAEEYQVRIRDKTRQEKAARTQARDLTKYDVVIAGTKYEHLPKRRAIYRIIRYLCDSGISPDEIRKAIDWKRDMMRCVAGNVDSAEFAKQLLTQLESEGNKPETGRYFIADDELIHSPGKTCAVTKMWGTQTTKAIDELLERFPDHGISYSESSE
jgi:hypothetical protein